MLLQRARGELQIVDECLSQPIAIGRHRSDAGQAVQPRTVQRRGIFDRSADAILKFADAIGQARDSSVPSRPVPRWQIVEYLHQPVPLQLLHERVDAVRIRKLALDRTKSSLRCSAEAFKEIDFREQH